MESEPTAAVRAASRLSEGFTWGVLAVCLLGWAIIGFFLWIPRVVRAVLQFSGALALSTMTETGAESAGLKLRRAADFYWRGFVGAVKAIRSTGEERGRGQAREEGAEAPSGLILKETAWALFVWYLVLWWIGYLEATPVDLLRSLAEYPWAEELAGVLRTFGEFPRLFGL